MPSTKQAVIQNAKGHQHCFEQLRSGQVGCVWSCSCVLGNSTASIDVCGCVQADQNVSVPIRKPEDCKLYLQQISLVASQTSRRASYTLVGLQSLADPDAHTAFAVGPSYASELAV